jgi:MSHA biogenesis protein MshO
MNSGYARGFTLIELVVVITLTGIIAVLVGRNITRPIAGFIDLSRRAELVDTAELALRRMDREIHLALPNSVRVSGGSSCSAPGGSAVCAVEFLRTLDGGRYRARAAGGPPVYCVGPAAGDRISFSAAIDCFEVLGTLNNLTDIDAAPNDQNGCLNGSVDCLVIFNTGQAGANAYNRENIAGITAATANSITFDITGNGVTRFPLPSPRQRFHIVDMPVSFVCDPGAGVMERHGDYDIPVNQVLDPGTTLNGDVSLLADRITSCTFTYDPGTNSRNALLTVALSVSAVDTQGNANTVSLLQEIQVPNIP